MGVKNTQFNTKSSWFSEYVSGKYVGYHSEQLTDATPSALQPTGMTATGGIIGDWSAPTGEVYRSHVFTSSGLFKVTKAADVGTPTAVNVFAVAGGGGSWSVKSSGILSSVSDLEITGLTKTTRIFLDITVGSDEVYTTLQTSSNNGSSFDGSSGDYEYSTIYSQSDGTNISGIGITSSTVNFSPSPFLGTGNASGECSSMEWTIYNPSNANTETMLNAEIKEIQSNGVVCQAYSVGKRSSIGIVNAIRLYPRNGTNFSGSYVCVELN